MGLAGLTGVGMRGVESLIRFSEAWKNVAKKDEVNAIRETSDDRAKHDFKSEEGGEPFG